MFVKNPLPMVQHLAILSTFRNLLGRIYYQHYHIKNTLRFSIAINIKNLDTET